MGVISSCGSQSGYLQDYHVSTSKCMISSAHTRATGLLPSQASISTVFQIDKKKSIPSTKGIRLIHCFCPLWRCALRAAILRGSKFDGPTWAYGGIEGKRGEGLVLSLRVPTYHLRRAGIPHLVKSYDATSAFHSGTHAELHATELARLRVEERNAPMADRIDAMMARQDASLIRRRRYNAMMTKVQRLKITDY